MPIPDIRIIHASRRFVIVDKPAGMLSVPGKGPDKQDCAAARVAAHFPHASGPLVVHRLDMDTSGLLVFGLDADAQRHLAMQFEARTTRKRYIALIAGMPPAESGLIDLPMRADIDRRPMQIIDHIRGRPSQTRYRLLALEPDRARLELEPVTGRTHQLRVHLAAIGLPIIGDVLYGPAQSSEAPTDASRLYLHASELTVADPETGQPVHAESRPSF